MAIGFLKRIDPEYVLEKAFEDLRKTGIDGLKPYLTSAAQSKFDTLRTVAGGVSLFTGTSGNALTLLLDKLSECEWTIRDVMKGSETAKGIVGFKYEDILEGTVGLSMIKEDKEWKIDNLDMPEFSKISLTIDENS